MALIEFDGPTHFVENGELSASTQMMSVATNQAMPNLPLMRVDHKAYANGNDEVVKFVLDVIKQEKSLKNGIYILTKLECFTL